MIARIFSITLIAACLVIAGCSASQPAILGQKPYNGPIVAISALKPSPQPQTIQGTMIDKCPVAGCWFHVKDASGVVKVDTKYSGFVVMKVPINATVTVSGVVHSGDDDSLEALGMSYR